MNRLKCEDILRGHDFKITQPRCDVLSTLSEVQHPMSVLDITKKLGKSSPNIVTIYRILESFVEKGLAKRIQLHAGEAMFEFAGFGDHHHIVCVRCDKIEEFDTCDVSGVLKKVLKGSRKFKSITQHTFELFGLCNTCARVR
jgi:Fur family ferric uptake transcriptional regulator